MIQKVKTHLSHDPVMAMLINTYPLLPLKPTTNLFLDIVETIAGQQLSVKAASTIISRFKELFCHIKSPSPQDIFSLPDENIRKAGLSYGKIRYIKGLCEAVIAKSMDLDMLLTEPDEVVVEELTKIKGIGRWTAEMILIFSLGRPDVFSVGDLGLRNAVSRLYRVDREDVQAIETVSLQWKPYRSTASRLLWKSLDNLYQNST